jgi:Tannase and feruloyl esterase
MQSSTSVGRWLVSSSAVGMLLVAMLLLAARAHASEAEACSALSNLTFQDVTAITATPVPANTFVPPAPFPGFPPSPPVPVPFCQVQIVVQPQINIEVWLPSQDSWNHRFQAVGGGGYAAVISDSALAMAVTGDSVTGQFATASTDTGHPVAGARDGQGGANGAQGGCRFALDPVSHTPNQGLIRDFASRSLHEMTLKAKAVISAYYGARHRDRDSNDD